MSIGTGYGWRKPKRKEEKWVVSKPFGYEEDYLEGNLFEGWGYCGKKERWAMVFDIIRFLPKLVLSVIIYFIPNLIKELIRCVNDLFTKRR